MSTRPIRYRAIERGKQLASRSRLLLLSQASVSAALLGRCHARKRQRHASTRFRRISSPGRDQARFLGARLDRCEPVPRQEGGDRLGIVRKELARRARA
jgi:hypothetical protein